MSKETRPPMHKAAALVLIGFFMLMTATQFTNCDGYSASSTLNGSSSVACTNAVCVSEIPSNLNVTAHVANGEYAVPSGLQEFNLGGDCNEGGYLSNTVHWDLVLNGRIVRSSDMQIAQGLTAESHCVNGRFLIYIPLTPLTINNADPTDRTGLLTGAGAGVRSAYDLHITIFVTDPLTGIQKYQTNVPLTAI